MAERGEVMEQEAVQDAPHTYSVVAKTASANDVPPGYKRTDAGVLPCDWEVSRVGEEFSLQLGKMLDSAKNMGTTKPYIGNRAVQWGVVNIDEIETVPMSRFDLKRYLLKNGDLLVCEGGEVGRSAIWDAPIPECYYQKALHRLRPKRGYNTFLMMSFLNLWASEGSLSRFVTQTSIAHLPKDKLAIIPLPVPSSTEQRAIATALSDADALIESLDRLIAKKRAIKQAAMQQLLTGQTRLPGFTGEWETKRLGELLTVRYGRNQSEIEKYDGRYPILATGGEIGRTDTPLYERPSVLIGRKGTIDEPRFMNFPFWTVDTLFYTEMHETAHTKFMFYIFTRIPWRTYNEASGVPSLNGKTIEAIQVSVPDIKEQTAIATVLSDMDSEIEALEHRCDKARQIKQGMTQQLLTGRIRLV